MALNASLFQQGFAHLWTIPVEFKFYFLLPFFAFFASKINNWLNHSAFFVFFLMLILLHQVAWPFWKTDINSIQLRWYLPVFFAGIFLAQVWEEIHKKLGTWIKTALSFTVIFFMILLSPGARNLIFSVPFDYWLADKFLLISGLWMIFIICTIKGDGFFGGLMKSKVLTWLGSWSYSIYLFHWLVY